MIQSRDDCLGIIELAAEDPSPGALSRAVRLVLRSGRISHDDALDFAHALLVRRRIRSGQMRVLRDL